MTPVSLSWLVIGILEALITYVIFRLFFSAVHYLALSNTEFHFCFVIRPLSNANLSWNSLLPAVVLTGRTYQIWWKHPKLTLYGTFNSSLLKKSQFTEEPIHCFADFLQPTRYCRCPNRNLDIVLPFFSSWGWTKELNLLHTLLGMGLDFCYSWSCVPSAPCSSFHLHTTKYLQRSGSINVSRWQPGKLIPLLAVTVCSVLEWPECYLLNKLVNE